MIIYMEAGPRPARGEIADPERSRRRLNLGCRHCCNLARGWRLRKNFRGKMLGLWPPIL